MAKNWYSLRPNEIIKKAKQYGWKDFDAIYLKTTIRLMPEPASIIGDKNWNGNGNWMIKVNKENFDWITTSRTSPFFGKTGKSTAGGKEMTYELSAGKVKGGESVPIKIRFRKSGKLTKTVAGTQEQELGSAFIFKRALNEDAGWNEWQDIVKDDKTYPELVKIFQGSVPDSWLISYFAQQKVLLEDVQPHKMSEFNRDGGFMKFIVNLINRKFRISNKDNWDPADIWIVSGDQKNIENRIKKSMEGPHQTLQELNGILRQMFKDGEVMGISLKKTGATAYYEKVNLDGLIPDTSEYNFDAPMSDFYSSFKIGSDGMFTQDVKITIDATQENKTFVFQIKANDSGSTSGSNLKFEPTAKGSGTARLGKAPVDEVVELLKDAKSTAVFVNKYQDYPGTETAFTTTNQKKGEKYYKETVLPALLEGNDKITSDMYNVDKVIANIKESYGTKMDKTTNVRAKLMGLDFFYQVSKLKQAKRNEFITDMIYLAQKKAFGKRPDFGPFGKIY
jgi:hypothetical protein